MPVYKPPGVPAIPAVTGIYDLQQGKENHCTGHGVPNVEVNMDNLKACLGSQKWKNCPYLVAEIRGSCPVLEPNYNPDKGLFAFKQHYRATYLFLGCRYRKKEGESLLDLGNCPIWENYEKRIREEQGEKDFAEAIKVRD